MPCAMMHLMCAREYDPDADISFFIGSVAPDCIKDRNAKDITHLRIYEGKEREDKLIDFSNKLDLTDVYQIGVLLHLYCDFSWDIEAIEDFKNAYNGEGWFMPYRHEINLIGSYYYHHENWAKTLWDDMEMCNKSLYSSVDIFPAEDIAAFLKISHDWHKKNNIGPSEFYNCDYVLDFCKRTVLGFNEWLSKNKIL